MNNVTVLFPGGFKPITGAHMALAQRYAQNPSVDKVIMLIGPKERDGITRDISIKMFNLLNRNNNIEIQSAETINSTASIPAGIFLPFLSPVNLYLSTFGKNVFTRT